MHITFNNNTYRITFNYGTRQDKTEKIGQVFRRPFFWAGKALENIRGKVIYTFCDISVLTGVDAENKKLWHSIAGDYAIRVVEDSFRKSVGRRRALTKTLYQINDKGLRTAIWDSYFKNHADPDVNKEEKQLTNQ